MAHFIPCNETATAPQVASYFMDHVFKLHGLPSDIVSDRGSVFVSKFWQRLMQLLQIKSNLTTAYHPQSDGQTERVNAVLEQYLRIYCNYQQDDWCSLLSVAEFAYNNATHSATCQTPFFANYGLHPDFDPDLSNESFVPAAEIRLKELKILHDSLKKNIAAAHKSYEKYYKWRKSMNAPEFAIGSRVWLIRKFIKTKRPCHKLDHRRLGPFKIMEKIGTLAYRLELPSSMQIHNVFHVSLLEPYHYDDDPDRTQVPPPPIEIDGYEMFAVEAILDSRVRRGKVEYLIHWEGYGPQDRTWQPFESLDKVKDLVCRVPFETRQQASESSA